MRAFEDHASLQCGFCGPGVILSAKALLDENPDPTRNEIRDGIAGKPFATYVYATQIAEVDVDDETGEVEILRIVAAHDCGTAINPMLVEGQVEGGISMGIGFALHEQILFDDAGRQINPNLTNYIVPTSLDMPEIEVDIVESFDPTGPFGAKGVGEPTSVPTAATILNAIHNAVGVRITSLPATPDKVLAAIQAQRGHTTPRIPAV